MLEVEPFVTIVKLDEVIGYTVSQLGLNTF